MAMDGGMPLADRLPAHGTIRSRKKTGLRRLLLHPVAKPLLFAACLLPFAWLVLALFTQQLGANPAEALQHATGIWALRFLCLTLAVTPLRVRTGTPQLARFRRMLGLFVFFYACLHLLTYLWFDMWFAWADIAADIPQRPFILAGFATWLALLPLALTSTNKMIRRLGARRWKWLHRLVYAVAALALLHFFWMRSGKHNYAEVWFYAAIIGLLLLERVLRSYQRKRQARVGALR